MNIHPDYNIKPLVMAVVTQAAREANEGNEEARQWIEDESIVWLDAIDAGIQPEKIKRWVSGGCRMSRRTRIKMQAQQAASYTGKIQGKSML